MYFALVSSQSKKGISSESLFESNNVDFSNDSGQDNSVSILDLDTITQKNQGNAIVSNVLKDELKALETLNSIADKEKTENIGLVAGNEISQGGRHHSGGGNIWDATAGRNSSFPGGGVDMTLSELQEMAARQQQQIESQQQILVVKEQRLKYLKQQEQKQQQLVSENERLRKLRDKVEVQEFKLKKLRVLRGQVEQQKASNGNLNYELESIKAIFNEKEKELSLAVAKVEEMTQQLEEIRSGRIRSSANTQSPAALAELEKLKKELMIRNKLNEQQNTKMAANREILARHKDEIARMDNRIHELQVRLKKKKAMSAEMMEKSRNQVNKPILNNILNYTAANVAAVDQYVPDLTIDNVGSGFGKQDPKYKSLPLSSKISYPDKMNPLSETNNNNVTYPAKQYNDSRSEEYSIPLVVSVASANKPSQNGLSPSPKQSPENTLPGNLPIPMQNMIQIPQSQPVSVANNSRFGTSALTRSGMSHFAPKPYGSIYSSAIGPNRVMGGIQNDQVHLDGQDDVRQSGSGQSSPGSVDSLNGSPKPMPSYAQVIPPMVKGQQVSRGPEMESLPKGRQPTALQVQNKGPPPVPNRTTLSSDIYQANNSAPMPSISKTMNSAISSQENISDYEETSISVSKGIQKFSVLIAQQNKDEKKTDGANMNSGGFSNLNHASALGAVRPAPTYRYASKSVIANTYFSKMDGETLEKYQKNVLSLHRDRNESSKSEVSSTAEANIVKKISEEDSLAPVANQNSPHSSSLTPSPGSPTSSSSYPFDFPSSPPHADVASDKVSYKPNTPKNIRRRHSDSDNEEVSKALHKYGINGHVSNSLPVQENQLLTLVNDTGTVEIQATAFNNHVPETVLLDNKGNIVEVLDNNVEAVDNTDEVVNDTENLTDNAKPPLAMEVKSIESAVKKKTNLKMSSSKRSNNRVSFDPLALLLDASLEGELDLVRRCAHQVKNVSASNDEGITALHNAICAGHYDIVTFLVEFGCDVNSPDSDGWTPLHCAASCNNLPMVKFLVEHGACIFATTISDHETAAEKCEEEEDGYDGCSEYLYSVQEKLGIINNGTVYAVFDYTMENSDELDLCIGDLFMVLRKGDDKEKEWWWAKKGNQEGYIPRNLLGLAPRVLPKAQPEGEV